MEITGVITTNAVVKTLADERQVTNFSIAINDSYKTKDGERKKLTTYVQCTYWRNAKMAQYLTKGTLVELSGRIDVNAWVGGNNEARANLLFHVNTIKLHGSAKHSDPIAPQTNAAPMAGQADDLPF